MIASFIYEPEGYKKISEKYTFHMDINNTLDKQIRHDQNRQI